MSIPKNEEVVTQGPVPCAVTLSKTNRFQDNKPGKTDSTILLKKTAIFFKERFMAAQHKEGYNQNQSVHIFARVQRPIDR